MDAKILEQTNTISDLKDKIEQYEDKVKNLQSDNSDRDDEFTHLQKVNDALKNRKEILENTLVLFYDNTYKCLSFSTLL